MCDIQSSTKSAQRLSRRFGWSSGGRRRRRTRLVAIIVIVVIIIMLLSRSIRRHDHGHGESSTALLIASPVGPISLREWTSYSTVVAVGTLCRYPGPHGRATLVTTRAMWFCVFIIIILGCSWLQTILGLVVFFPYDGHHVWWILWWWRLEPGQQPQPPYQQRR